MDLANAIAPDANLQPGGADSRLHIDEERNVLVVSTLSLVTAAALNCIKKLAISDNTFDIASPRHIPRKLVQGCNLQHWLELHQLITMTSL